MNKTYTNIQKVKNYTSFVNPKCQATDKTTISEVFSPLTEIKLSIAEVRCGGGGESMGRVTDFVVGPGVLSELQLLSRLQR